MEPTDVQTAQDGAPRATAVDPGLTLGDPWYGPTDIQVVTSIQGMGLDVFPFGAYDAYGRLKVDPAVNEPLKRELRNVLEQPVWTDLWKELSLFDNPGYECFALGYRASNRGLRILAFRQLAATTSPETCGRLQQTIAEQRLPIIRESAGRHYVVQPRWIEVVREVLALVGGGSLADRLSSDEEPDPDEIAAAIGWQAALGIVLSLLEIANKIGRAPRVDCTVVWRWVTWSTIPKEQTKRWAPIGTVGLGSGSACTGVLWDKAGKNVWWWGETTPWPAGFQFSARGIWQSLYPSGQLVEAQSS